MSADAEKPSPPSPLRNPWLLGVVGVIVVGVGLLLPGLGGANQAVAPQGEFRPEAPDLGPMLLRLGGGTVVVLGLCVATLWSCRRWLGAGQPTAVKGGNFEIVESLPLGVRCRVHLVRVGERFMLAGIDTTGLRTLIPVDGVIQTQE